MMPNKVNPVTMMDGVAGEQAAFNHKMMNTSLQKQSEAEDGLEKEMYLGACEYLTQIIQQLVGNIETMQVQMDQVTLKMQKIEKKICE